MKTTILGLLVGLALASSLNAGTRGQEADPIGDRVRDGQDAMYRLDYPRAIDVFTEIVDLAPESPVGYGMLAIARWNLMLYAAANPAIHPYGTPNPYADAGGPAPSIEAETQWFHQANDRLLEVSEGLLARNPEDVTALYFRGLAFENQAAEAIVIGRDKRGAIGPGMEAKRTHERVLELDPTFTDARMSLAAYEYALATVDGFAGLVLALPRLFGFFRGDLDGALATMETAARLGRYRALDARVILSMMHAFEGDPERSVAILESLGRQYPENYLLDLSRAAIQEWRMNDPEAALETYRALLVALPAKHPGLGEAEVRLRIGRTLVGLERYAEARTAFLSALEAAASESETHPLCRESLALLPKRSPVVPGGTDSP